jgi:hypothetical protein
MHPWSKFDPFDKSNKADRILDCGPNVLIQSIDTND